MVDPNALEANSQKRLSQSKVAEALEYRLKHSMKKMGRGVFGSDKSKK